MPETLAGALQTPGLGWLFAIVFIAGTVRGFAGFGGALIAVPLASFFISPVWALTLAMVMDVTGALPLLPRAVRDGAPRSVAQMVLGCALLLPVGVWLLLSVEPLIFRWVVSLVALGLIVLLASGWRHDWRLRWPGRMAIGGASGILGGFSGLPGPPVILAYLAGNIPPARVRGDTLLYLLCFDLLLGVVFALRGVLEGPALWLGFVLVVPNVAGNLIGAWLFDPAHVVLYRRLAYAIIAATAVMSMPIWGI